MAVFTDAQLQRLSEKIQQKNAILYKFVDKYGTNTWAKVQAIVKAGLADQIFNIGDEMICKYRYSGTDYDWTWCVADFREVINANGETVPGMVLQSKYCTNESIVFDAPEQVEATEESALEGIYYYGLTGTSVSAANLTLLDLDAGDTIPYTAYDKIFKSDINDTSKNIIQYGLNRYLWSAARKWLNSNAAVGEDWFGELDHIGQVKPANALTLAGFMSGLDSDFLAVVNPTKITTYNNTVCFDGSPDHVVDRFWLPSIEEMYGVPQIAGEGQYMQYWQDRTGLTAPSNSTCDERKIIPIGGGSVQTCRLRSANRSSSNTAWLVSTSGNLTHHNASATCRFAPACVIC